MKRSKERVSTSNDKIRTQNKNRKTLHLRSNKLALDRLSEAINVQIDEMKKQIDSPKKSKKKLHESPSPPQSKKLSDVHYQQDDAPVERLTFGPTPLQNLVEQERTSNSPNSPQRQQPFDSPSKLRKSKRRKDGSRLRKEIFEMQKLLQKKNVRDSDLKSMKDRLKHKTTVFHKQLAIGHDMAIYGTSSVKKEIPGPLS